MTFEEYQQQAYRTALYPNKDNNFIYPTLGLASEAGEVAGKIKKVIRDKGGIIDDTTREDIKKELGDVLWYVSQIASELGLDLSEIVDKNIHKINSRVERGVLQGEGDNR